MSVEFWALFLLELGFMLIIGLMYTIPVIIAVYLSEWIKKKFKRDDKDGNEGEKRL